MKFDGILKIFKEGRGAYSFGIKKEEADYVIKAYAAQIHDTITVNVFQEDEDDVWIPSIFCFKTMGVEAILFERELVQEKELPAHDA